MEMLRERAIFAQVVDSGGFSAAAPAWADDIGRHLALKVRAFIDYLVAAHAADGA